jgi:hypothetical protein
MNSGAPDTISHDALLAALELKSFDCGPSSDENADAVPSVYRMQLRHSLLSLARRAHLAHAALELTGLPESELAKRSTVELLRLLDQKRANLSPAQANQLRYW